MGPVEVLWDEDRVHHRIDRQTDDCENTIFTHPLDAVCKKLRIRVYTPNIAD